MLKPVVSNHEINHQRKGTILLTSAAARAVSRVIRWRTAGEIDGFLPFAVERGAEVALILRKRPIIGGNTDTSFAISVNVR